MRVNYMLRGLAAAMLVTFAFGAEAQQAPPPAQNQTIRGTIAAFDGKVLSVKSRDGRDLSIDVPDNVNVAVAKAFTIADIKPGMNLAVVTVNRPDGSVIALDVRPLPANINVNSIPYDLAPGSVMNNAPLEGVVQSAGGTELTLNGKNGVVKALIVPQTTMSQNGSGTRDDIKVGETVFAAARPEADGKLTAVRLQVSKDGVKPGQ